MQRVSNNRSTLSPPRSAAAANVNGIVFIDRTNTPLKLTKGHDHHDNNDDANDDVDDDDDEEEDDYDDDNDDEISFISGRKKGTYCAVRNKENLREDGCGATTTTPNKRKKSVADGTIPYND